MRAPPVVPRLIGRVRGTIRRRSLLKGGETVVVPTGQVDIEQQPSALFDVPAAANLSDVVNALNALGATPMDLVSILQAMKAAGALHAELIVQ